MPNFSTPSAEPVAIPDKRHRLHARIAVWATYALILLGGPIAALSSFVFVMASAACAGPDKSAVICQAWGQQLVMILPLAALFAGFLLCVCGITMARSGRRPLVWTVSGWAVYVVGLVVAGTIATSA